MAYQPVKRRRRRRRGGRFVTIALVLMCIAVLIGLSAFFRVSEIEVKGLSRYDEAEAAEKSGVEPGDNLFLLRESDIAINLRKSFPYIEDVQIKRELPDKVVITVTESEPVAYVASDGAYWKLDKSLRLLERTDSASVAGLIELLGVSPVSPSEGQAMALGLEEDAKLAYIRGVLEEICARGLEKETESLDAGNISRMTFAYGGRIKVIVGSGAELETKFNMLLRVLADVGESGVGTADISDVSEAHFIPE